jgi:hypothetical protein
MPNGAQPSRWPGVVWLSKRGLTLALSWELGTLIAVATDLDAVASLLAATGEARAAIRLFAAADQVRQTLGAALLPSERSLHDGHLSASVVHDLLLPCGTAEPEKSVLVTMPSAIGCSSAANETGSSLSKRRITLGSMLPVPVYRECPNRSDQRLRAQPLLSASGAVRWSLTTMRRAVREGWGCREAVNSSPWHETMPRHPRCLELLDARIKSTSKRTARRPEQNPIRDSGMHAFLDS